MRAVLLTLPTALWGLFVLIEMPSVIDELAASDPIPGNWADRHHAAFVEMTPMMIAAAVCIALPLLTWIVTTRK
jgi:hypothetical protein